MQTAREIIEKLELMPHPEGGYYREIFRSEKSVLPVLEKLHGEDPLLGEKRSSVTSIFFLLEAGDFSAFHQVKSDEIWHLISGGPLELHVFSNSGEYECHHLAVDHGGGWNPQAVVRAGRLQASRPAPGSPYCLCSCLVAPGFEFKDFYMPSRAEMLAILPQHRELITELTRR
jgi:predicted cupin superfamily sugar epimerase